MAAFTLPKVPKVRLPKGRRRAAPKHRDAPGRPHPVVPVGGSTRSTRTKEPKYRGEHEARAGIHRGPRPTPRARDPFYAPTDTQTSVTSRPGARSRQRPAQGAVGQPQAATRGNPRARFGQMSPPRVTDMAPAYRAAGQPARTPREQRDADMSRDALIRATKAAQAERKRATARGAAEHQPAGRGGRTRPQDTGTTYRSKHATRATARAPRPPAQLPGDSADRAARAAARSAGRKGSSGRDPRPQASHPFFAGGNRAAPHVPRGEKYGDAT